MSFVNATAIRLDLKSWTSAGCPITGISVKYKQQQEMMWTAIADSSAQDQELLVDGLHPQTWYTVQVTADSDAGASEQNTAS